MKKKILLSPLIIIVFIIVAGVSIAGAALLIGNSGDNSASTAIDLQRGLVGWWKFDGNAKDATPYRHHGTVTGAVLANDRKGEAQKAYGFDGATNRIALLSDGSALGITTTATFSFWYKANTQVDTRRIFGYTTSYAQNGQWLFYQTATVLTFGIKNNNLDTGCSTATIDLTAAWHHIVGTISAAGIGTLYVDGVNKCSSPAATGSYNNTNPIGIGVNNATLDFDGYADDVRIYNRVLSQAEITALYGEYNPGLQISNLQSGLVGWWKFDGNAKDSTPNRNHGTVTGAVLVNDRKGQAQKAYNFNGTSDNIDLGTGSSLSPSTAISWTAWIKTSSSDRRGIIARGGQQFQIDVGKLNPFVRIGTDGSNTDYGLTGIGTINSNTWRFVAVTYTSGSFLSYIDGVLDATRTDVTGNLAPQTTNSLIIGKVGLGNFFFGSIGDVRVYNRALSATEVTALYQEYSPGIVVSDLSKGLVGRWSLDGNAKDSTPYRNHGTVNGPVLTTDRKGEINKAYLFNGTSDWISIGNPAVLRLTTAVTVSAWINQSNSGTGEKRVVFKSGGGYGLIVNNNLARIAIRENGNGNLFTNLDGTTTIAAGTWYHLAGTFDGNVIRIYVNGVQENSTAKTMTMLDGNNTLGIGVVDATNYFPGSISGVRIYNRALSATEVAALYQTY